jgi:nicotinic acid phosphoribosyltransferase
VAVIVALGMLWAHVSGGGTGPGAGIRQAPPPQVLQRLGRVKGGEIPVSPGTVYHPSGFRLTGFDLTQSGNLIRTGMIEAVLAAVVITVSAIRRRHRRMRRAASTAST